MGAAPYRLPNRVLNGPVAQFRTWETASAALVSTQIAAAPGAANRIVVRSLYVASLGAIAAGSGGLFLRRAVAGARTLPAVAAPGPGNWGVWCGYMPLAANEGLFWESFGFAGVESWNRGVEWDVEPVAGATG